MPDKKLTDTEIVKALECCVLYNQICPKSCPMANDKQCMPNLRKNSLDLINRLQAENERLTTLAELGNMRANDYRVMRDRALKAEAEKQDLEIELKVMRGVANRFKAENEKLVGNVDKLYAELFDKTEQLKTAKAEAYKECIEKVKEEIAEALKSNYKARAEREQSIPIFTEYEFLNYCTGKIDCLRGLDDFLDNLLKEMIGE